jgi:hypothetical protein
MDLPIAFQFRKNFQGLQRPFVQDLGDDFPDLGIRELGAAKDPHLIKYLFFDLFIINAAGNVLEGHQATQDQDAKNNHAHDGHFPLLHIHFPSSYF